MLKNITLGQYLPGDSVIHRLDPRTKIVTTGIFIIVLFLISSWWGYLLFAGFLGYIIYASKISVRFVFGTLRPLLIILLLTLILNMFLTPGELLYQLGPLKVTYEGVVRAFQMAIRLVLLILATNMLTLTTSPIDLTDGMESLLKPFSKMGVPAHELAMMMTIALRFIPTLLEEADKIMKAQMARGADFETGNVMQRAKALVPILVPLFVSAFRRADDLAMAMEARAYRGGQGRTRFRQLQLSQLDYAAWGIVTLITVGLIVL